jgi:protein-S-isoprenylcysteine O-methyltransferase Ste14
MHTVIPTSPVSPLTHVPRRWPSASDWAGFVGHAGIAVLMVVRAPWISLFLIPSLVHMLMAACSFLVRDQPKVLGRDPLGRVVAYAGGFGVFAFVQFATLVRPEWLTPTTDTRFQAASILCGLVGVFFEIWAIWHLRRAFATEPAARRLITTGPYQFSRHPIYTGAVFAQLGVLLGYPTLPIAIAIAGWAACTRMRVHYEEAALLEAFPEYASYRQRVSALVPMLRPRRASLSVQ